MEISVIIPVVNEAEHLKKLLPLLYKEQLAEVIVVDGGSSDESKSICNYYNVKLLSSERGRAKQMNKGAAEAEGDILHFIHADSIPPKGFAEDVLNTVSEQYRFGCFRSLFQTDSWFLRMNSYFSRFKGMMFRGGGQSLWIDNQFFHQLGGFDEKLKLMEEYDFIKRAKKHSDYKVIQKDMQVSASTYDENGNFKTQLVYALVMFAFFRGIHQDRLIRFIRYWLK